MEFFDFVKKSNYIDQHMSKPANFTDVKAGRSMRLQAKVEERKTRRVDQFNKNRDIEVESEPSKQNKVVQKQTAPTGIHAKSQERLKQLQLWKAEKEMKKRAAACDKQKPFVVSVVRKPLALFKSPTPVKKVSAQKCVPSISDRVTRSGRVDCRITNKPTQPQQSTFAPHNAKFHPPQLKKMHDVVFGQRPPVAKPNLANNKVRSHVGMTSAPKPKTAQGLHDTRSKRNATTIKSGAKEVPYKTTINENKKIKTRIQEKSQEIKDYAMKREVESDILINEINYPKSDENCLPTKSLKTSNSGSSTESIKTPPTQMIPEHLRNEVSNMSPFVTMSRGKKNIRKEILSKLKDGCISDDSNDQKSPQHFRRQLDSEIIRLRQICNEWQTYKDENERVIPENEQDLIFQAIGQTNLLISKKFEQFRDLVQRCEDQVLVEGEGLVTSSDLQGFWDMVFIQVENLDIRFKNLMELRQNKWVKNVEVDLAPMKKAAPRTKRAAALPTRKGNSKIRDMIEAARKAAAAKIAKEESNLSIADVSAPVLEVPVKNFDAGFFKVSSPMKERNIPAATPNKNTSLFKEVLSSEARRISSKKATASSMAMMRASCVAKRMSNNVDIYTSLDSIPPMNQVNLNATPARSILKTPLTNKKPKDGKKSIKVVLFSPEDEDDDLQEPQPLGNMEFLGETENNCMEITNTITEHEDKVPHIIRKLDSFTIVTPVVQNGSSNVAKRKGKGRRMLERQAAVASGDNENFPPSDEDDEAHCQHTAEDSSVQLKRITRSQRRQDTISTLQETLSANMTPSKTLSKTPRKTPNKAPHKTPNKTPKKTPSRNSNRRPTELLGKSESNGNADLLISPFTREEKSMSCNDQQTDLISFDSPAHINGPIYRRRSTRIASIARD